MSNSFLTTERTKEVSPVASARFALKVMSLVSRSMFLTTDSTKDSVRGTHIFLRPVVGSTTQLTNQVTHLKSNLICNESSSGIPTSFFESDKFYCFLFNV